jgi:UDP-N-acetylglucosamine 2-epimerase (non-hydrolysing)
MVVMGTRPEAIKLLPVVEACKADGMFDVVVVVTAQHREMLDQALDLWGCRPDVDLNLMQPGQDPSGVTVAIISAMGTQFRSTRPDVVIVQGDTTTTFATALAAFYERVPVAHVEAGLRSGRKYAPFPEEMNRRVTSVIADIHFAPTRRAEQNLLAEGVTAQSIHVVGNTVIDALFQTKSRIANGTAEAGRLRDKFPFLGSAKRTVLVTAHRRESFGEGFAEICKGIVDIVAQTDDVQVVYPVHPNPAVQEAVDRFLRKSSAGTKIHLLDPVSYLELVYLLDRSYLVLTDSGGLQEEGPALGKPVLVMRDVTERPEAVEAGSAKLVGASRERIRTEVLELLSNEATYARMAKVALPFGDGHAASRIAGVLAKVTLT